MDLLPPTNTPRPAQINAALLILRMPQRFDVGDVGVSMLQRRIEGGAEYALMQLLVAIALLITGAGAYSLTPRLPKPLRKL